MEQHSSRPQIGRTALIVGAVGFAIGYIAPVLLSDSNLGPLLGIFITGPAGLVVGALIGILRSALGAGERMLTSELRWLGLVWLASLLLTLFTSLLGWAVIGLAMQCAVVAALLLLVATPRRRLPGAALLGAPLLVAGAALIILASAFPPLLDPKLGEPRFAFLLDARFDASHHVPQFTADWTMLIVEWLAIASATAALLLLLHIAMSPRRD